MITNEYWLFADGTIINTIRTDTGFVNAENGQIYTKHQFLQYVQGSQGHLITREAFKRIKDGQRTHEEDQ